MACCIKTICNGCAYANALREEQESLVYKCPFCRHPIQATQEEADKDIMRRVEANDPVAMRFVGTHRALEGDSTSALKYLTKAATLGDAVAHYHLAVIYHEERGVEKDEKKAIYHMEEAAIAGHPDARYDLGYHEGINGRIERAVKHWIIASNLGNDDSIQRLKQCYADGQVSKEEFAAALRAHHAAVEATKSPQREAAERSGFFREDM
jgi:TPR repeat protein